MSELTERGAAARDTLDRLINLNFRVTERERRAFKASCGALQLCRVLSRAWRSWSRFSTRALR